MRCPEPCAQRLLASKVGTQEKAPSIGENLAGAQRLLASKVGTRESNQEIRFPPNCAQRLLASKVGTLPYTSTPEKITRVLNAYWHLRLEHLIGRLSQFNSIGCSTPTGI